MLQPASGKVEKIGPIFLTFCVAAVLKLSLSEQLLHLLLILKQCDTGAAPLHTTRTLTFINLL